MPAADREQRRDRDRAKARAMPTVQPVDRPRRERVVDAELVDPAPRGGLLEVFSMGYLLRLIVKRELAKMYAASVLGLLWSYIQPATRFVVYFFVFGVVMQRQDLQNYAVHLFCGMVFISYFTESWGGGTRSIRANKQLVMKMRVPREIFPVSMLIVAFYHTGPQLLLLTAICLFIGWHLTWSAVLAGLLGVAILVLFSMAMGLLFAALNVYAQDTQNVVATFGQFLHFMVPMIYPFSLIADLGRDHPIVYELYLANPLSEAVMLMQKLFWAPLADHPSDVAANFPPDLWERGLIMLGVCAGLVLIAQRIFRRLEARIPELLL
ncbi:MAG TPA: ABC transporter permease [Marmoricola sp.]|nr:ABC transporter permease [Marmoricola sp.]